MQNGARSHDLECMQPLECAISVRSEVDGPFACRYYLSIFSASGQRVTRLASPVHEFNGEVGKISDVRVVFDPVRLGPGDYFVKSSILEPSHEGTINECTVRYDLLARFYPFKVRKQLDYLDPVVFYHPVEWSFHQLSNPDNAAAAQKRSAGNREMIAAPDKI